MIKIAIQVHDRGQIVDVATANITDEAYAAMLKHIGHGGPVAQAVARQVTRMARISLWFKDAPPRAHCSECGAGITDSEYDPLHVDGGKNLCWRHAPV